MILSILNFILFLVFLYLVLYGVYLLTINIKALLSSSKFISANELTVYNLPSIENKICVIIFANSKSKRLEPLLQALNEQTYNKEKYCVHVVYAKDSNSISYTPDYLQGAQIHCVENPEFFSKNKALNAFVEKLLVESQYDGYVFLGSSRHVANDYIEKVNFCLNKFPLNIITGKTTVIPKTKSLKSKAVEVRQIFKNNTVNISRRMFELFSVIDSENCIIPSEILEKTGRICFETEEDELKYSLFLASNGIRPLYSPFLETSISAERYNPVTSGFGIRFLLFKYYLKLLFNKPWHFIEFVLSLMQPNVVMVLALYFLLFYASFRFISMIHIKYIFHLGAFYLFVWALGLFASKLKPKQMLFFLSYPLFSFIFNFTKMTKDFARSTLQKMITEEKNIKTATMDAIVTDGTKDVMCKMDLISDDGMRRVILRFRKKRVISDESIRMCDALQNVSKRVNTHNLTLKVCQNCKNFTPSKDGTVDLLKGVCNVNTLGEKPFETLIWNTCDCFKPETCGNDIENQEKN